MRRLVCFLLVLFSASVAATDGSTSGIAAFIRSRYKSEPGFEFKDYTNLSYKDDGPKEIKFLWKDKWYKVFYVGKQEQPPSQPYLSIWLRNPASALEEQTVVLIDEEVDGSLDYASTWKGQNPCLPRQGENCPVYQELFKQAIKDITAMIGSLPKKS